ncbi:hypothetical protein ACFWUQ_19960 [Streptomyces sp. NPDC058662]|uniref:hypothetical protein n=1 Tax=Streptomyces sp. NPDC058662 TaxID=3346583 RepID=UPI00364B68E3
MIGEPELDGDWEAGPPTARTEPGTPGATGEPGGPGDPGGPVRGRARPWGWALGGALLASAVWAGALTVAVQDRFADRPRIAYRHAENLCDEVSLDAVAAAAVPLVGDQSRGAARPAKDWSYCVYGADSEPGRMAMVAEVLVELHKEADPGAEFGLGPGATAELWQAESAVVEEVPGIGRRALMNRTPGSLRLQVLDGGAVFTLGVEWFGDDDAPEVDEDALKTAMIEDMRALTAALRK